MGLGTATKRGRPKRDQPTGVKCVRRDVTLPPYYDLVLDERAKSRGIGRSEAFRQLVEEAQGRAPKRLLQEIREQTSLIMMSISSIKLVSKNPDTIEELNRMRAAGDRIQKILADLAAA